MASGREQESEWIPCHPRGEAQNQLVGARSDAGQRQPRPALRISGREVGPTKGIGCPDALGDGSCSRWPNAAVQPTTKTTGTLPPGGYSWDFLDCIAWLSPKCGAMEVLELLQAGQCRDHHGMASPCRRRCLASALLRRERAPNKDIPATVRASVWGSGISDATCLKRRAPVPISW